MSDSVDDDLADRFLRHLVFDGRGGACGACADRSSEFGQDEIHRIIHLFKKCALKDLMGRDGLGDLSAVVVGALDDGSGRVLLRVSAEQQECGVCDTVAVGQL